MQNTTLCGTATLLWQPHVHATAVGNGLAVQSFPQVVCHAAYLPFAHKVSVGRDGHGTSRGGGRGRGTGTGVFFRNAPAHPSVIRSIFHVSPSIFNCHQENARRTTQWEVPNQAQVNQLAQAANFGQGQEQGTVYPNADTNTEAHGQGQGQYLYLNGSASDSIIQGPSSDSNFMFRMFATTRNPYPAACGTHHTTCSDSLHILRRCSEC